MKSASERRGLAVQKIDPPAVGEVAVHHVVVIHPVASARRSEEVGFASRYVLGWNDPDTEDNPKYEEVLGWVTDVFPEVETIEKEPPLHSSSTLNRLKNLTVRSFKIKEKKTDNRLPKTQFLDTVDTHLTSQIKGTEGDRKAKPLTRGHLLCSSYLPHLYKLRHEGVYSQPREPHSDWFIGFMRMSYSFNLILKFSKCILGSKHPTVAC